MDNLIKMALNPGSAADMALLGASVGYNWQWMKFQRPIQEAAWKSGKRHVIWPMVRRAGFWGTDREKECAQWLRDFPGGPVLIQNEPNDAGQDGYATIPTTAAIDAAESMLWVTAIDPSAKFIVGGILDLHGRYDAEDWGLAFAQALMGQAVAWDRVLGLAWHTYLPEVPANRARYTEAQRWCSASLQRGLRVSHKLLPSGGLYVTEWGVLRSGYSQRDADMEILGTYMERAWTEMLGIPEIKAAGWYLAKQNTLTGLADFVLADGGKLRKMGEVYTALSTVRDDLEDPTEPEPETPAAELVWSTKWTSGDGRTRVQQKEAA